MRRIAMMVVIAAALLTATVATTAPVVADNGCWVCNSAA